MAEEHVTLFNNALDEWEIAAKEQNMSAYNNAISLMLLAIKKSPEPIARIHAYLARAYYEAADCQLQQPGRHSEKQFFQLINNALRYADSALKIDPLEFRAQLVKTFLSTRKLGIGLFFRRELNRLKEIYDRAFSEYYVDASEYCQFTKDLLNIADYCINDNKKAIAKDIFTSILNVNLDDLDYDDLSDDGKVEVGLEVAKLRSLAEGRLMMLT
jgi:tetratricopeptide (TPR) repeat protein